MRAMGDGDGGVWRPLVADVAPNTNACKRPHADEMVTGLPKQSGERPCTVSVLLRDSVLGAVPPGHGGVAGLHAPQPRWMGDNERSYQAPGEGSCVMGFAGPIRVQCCNK